MLSGSAENIFAAYLFYIKSHTHNNKAISKIASHDTFNRPLYQTGVLDQLEVYPILFPLDLSEFNV